MRRCLVSPGLLDSPVCALPAETAHHLAAVLRIEAGEKICLLDGAGRRRVFSVESVMRKGVVCRAESEPETFPAPQSPVTLLQCIAKGPRMDWLVEKATELGALRIVPVVSGRTVCRFRPGEIIDRWQRIADSAIEQCDGVWRTEIMPVATFAGMLDALARCPVKMAAALTPDAVPIAEFLRESAAGETAVCIGPEGDFSPEEYDSLRAAGAKMAGLGTRVLRVETAAVYALSAISAFRV